MGAPDPEKRRAPPLTAIRGCPHDGLVFEVTSFQATQLERLRREHDIKLVIAFGSKVKGSTHRFSDLDIGLLFDYGGPSLKCIEDLNNIFPSEEVDLAFLNRADPLFLGQINSQCVLLSGSERDFNAFRCYAFQRSVDFLPYLAMEKETNTRRLGTY